MESRESHPIVLDICFKFAFILLRVNDLTHGNDTIIQDSFLLFISAGSRIIYRVHVGVEICMRHDKKR